MSSNNVIIALFQKVKLVTSDSQAKVTEASSPFLLPSRPGVTVDTEKVKPTGWRQEGRPACKTSTRIHYFKEATR